MNEDPISEQASRTYRSLMHEIKVRIDAIDLALGGGMNPFIARFVEEFCYLQLRMICELIAFACLVVHDNLGPKSDLYKTHKADWIMGELEKLHPDFFPTAFVTERHPKGQIWNDRLNDTLTMSELKSLWSRECGSRLHRGSVKTVMTHAMDVEIPKVRTWVEKIANLLEQHYILTPDKKFMLQVVMDNGDGNVASRTTRLNYLDEPR
jgi:hypothetical protein